MKVQNIVRKAVALGSGAALVGTTLMGAFAYDLSTYPAKYVVDGKFDGKIIVGEKAATADVLGSIDIAASLQGASVVKVPVPGKAGTASFSGLDTYELNTGADQVELREPIGDVVDTVTSSDLQGLKSGSITTSEGTTDFHQYLRFKDGTNLQNMTVNFVENDDDVMADYLVVDTDSPFIEWEIQFPEGLESEVEDGELKDIEDRTFNIMGTDFTVVRGTITGDDVELLLMGGSVPDTLREGETKVYSINGVDYEVQLVFVSDPNSGGNPEVKFSVNGEVTQSLSEGDTDTLSGGLQIGVRDILVNAREGVASFFIGADKIVFTDNTATSSSGSTQFDGSVEINNENINDGDVSILGANTSGATKFEITSVKYRLTMDAADGTTAFIAKGKGVKEFMKRPDSLISDTLDVKYGGLTTPATKNLEINPSGDDAYEMTFTNIDGVTYTFPLLTNEGGTWKFGDQDDDLVFVEGADQATYVVGSDDYILLSNDRGASDADKSVTNVLRYTDYDATDRTVEFEEVGTGNTISVPIATSGIGSLVVGGHTYAVNVSNTSASEPTLSVDLDADSSYDGVTKVTAWGGVIVDLLALAELNASVNVTSSTAATTLDDYIGNGKTLETAQASGSSQFVRMSATVLAKNFDTSDGGNEQLNWTISEVASGNEVDLDVSSTSFDGPLSVGTGDVTGFQFVEKDGDDDHTIGMTDWGIYVDEYDQSSGGSDPNELTLEIPEEQRYGQVFVTLGDAELIEGASGSGTMDKINPIAVGLAVLDKDAPAIGSENLIVIGGPCANTVAAALMNNPAECGEGFEPGKAMIKSSEKNGKVAILVAGYEATETQGASRVLAAYKDHAKDLKGTEVQVTVAGLNSIKVGPAMTTTTPTTGTTNTTTN